LFLVQKTTSFRPHYLLDHIADRCPAVEDRVLVFWNSLGVWIIEMRSAAEGQARDRALFTTLIIAQAIEHWYDRYW
jgi:hypothetical protein